MSETTTTPTAPTESERRLIRPADDRVVAGVCSGLARYFGLDPLVYRIAFAALVLLGGSGLILYAAAWLVIPDERRGESLVEDAIRHHRDRPWLVVGVGLLAFGLLFGLTESHLWPDAGNLWLAALAVGLGIVWWQMRERPRAGAAGTTAAAATTAPGAPGTAPLPVSGAETSFAEAPAPKRRRIPIFLPTIGAMLVGAGVLGILEITNVVDVDWALALAVAVVLVGLAVAVGAFFGATGALAAIGTLLAAAMVLAATVDIPLHGPIGERDQHPVTMTELEATYEHSIGTLQLDLHGLVLPAGTTHVAASVGVGELTVLVPAGVRVEVDAHVKAGESVVFDNRQDGWDVTQHVTVGDETATGSTLVLDAEVGFGNLEVHAG